MLLTWTVLLQAGGPNATPRARRLKLPLIPYLLGIDWQLQVVREGRDAFDEAEWLQRPERGAGFEEDAQGRLLVA
ncbi:hypothetical protein Q8F55_005432 [Vanrija albida]|uniref:Uncharacterized protein n=1 Tax=Vanrija albida TaxID=181172 RepID=A0ABR3Q1M6_9TREE